MYMLNELIPTTTWNLIYEFKLILFNEISLTSTLRSEMF